MFSLFHGEIGTACADEEFSKTVAPFLESHCQTCHGADVQESQIRFDRISGFRAEDRHLWTKVHQMVSTGQMPPEELPQPGEKEKRAVLSWIEENQRKLEAGSVRRLNRRELSAALRDLTGRKIDYALGLPGDGKVGGFDTGAEGLQDAASSVGQMMEVTRRAVAGIRFLEPPSGQVFEADLRDVKDVRRALDPWKEEGAKPKLRGDAERGLGLLIQPKWVGERGDISVQVPAPPDRRGVLRLELVVSQKTYFPGTPPPHLWVEVGGKDVAYEEITATPETAQKLVYEVQLEDVAVEADGVTISLSNRVELPYQIEGFENETKSKPEENIPATLFRPDYNKKAPPEEQPVPFVVLHRIKVEPNSVAAWPPTDWEANVEDVNDDPQTARKLLALWLERAWRRPVSEAEQKRFRDLDQKLREQGLSFDESLRAVFQSVLLSGPFRYLSSPADEDPRIAQHAIASRLSFLLVGSPPDQELRQLAAAGKLREPGVLKAQVDRLFADPESERFVRPFVVQWLEMEQPITLVMDYFQQQDFRFGRFLKSSMKKETLRYFTQLLAENKPAEELIHSDWTMMNNSLAWHYGYDGIDGGHFRKVKLRQDDPRGGGILGHAGIQSMLCWMGDNWVIYRGAWTLRHILDDPPPQPPLEVPELDPTASENRGKTFKELLKQHQNHAKCAVCHKDMDPLGFAFQNFDISGRWRAVEYEKYERRELDGKIAWRGVGETRPVNATGHLPRGEEFDSFAECKKLMVEHYLDDIVYGLMKKWMLYATGRTSDVDDLAEIRTIMKKHVRNGYPLRDLLKAVVCSQAFLDP